MVCGTAMTDREHELRSREASESRTRSTEGVKGVTCRRLRSPKREASTDVDGVTLKERNFFGPHFGQGHLWQEKISASFNPSLGKTVQRKSQSLVQVS